MNKTPKRPVLSRTTAFAAAVLLLATGLTSCASPAAVPPDEGSGSASEKREYAAVGQHASGMDIAAENSRFRLLIEPEHRIVALENKETGRIWKSCPDDINPSSVPDDDSTAERLAQISLKLYDSRGKDVSLSSYKDSVAKGQSALYSIEQGIRIEYVIGEGESVSIYPDALPKEYMENELLPKLTESEKKRVLQFFKPFDYATTEEGMKAQLTEKYKNFETVPLYVSKTIGVRYKAEITDALNRVGFTSDILKEQYDIMGYDAALNAVASVFLPVEYRLTESGLQVRVVSSQCTYDSSFYLETIDVLPYFGSVGKKEGGYLFYPDGSGALVDLNTNETIPASVNIYGDDLTAMDEDHDDTKVQSGCIGAYGIKDGDDAFVALITEGASLAQVKATPPASPQFLNTVYPSFTRTPRLSIDAESLVLGHTIVRYAREPYKGDYVMEYRFLENENADYVGMAAAVRDQLFPDTGESGSARREDSLLIDMYGILDREERILGIPVTRHRAYTTFSQAAEILRQLREGGVDSAGLYYHNLTGDPLESGLTLDFKPHGNLQKGMKTSAFLENLQDMGVAFYPAFDLLYLRRDSLFDDFRSSADGVTGLDRETAMMWQSAYGEDDEGKHILSPLSVLRYAEKLAGKLQKRGLTGVGLTSMGTDLYANYSDRQFFLRNRSEAFIQEALQSFSGSDLLIEGGNAYAYGLAGCYVDVPLEDSSYAATSRSVPFVQLVLHGHADYASVPLNLSDDYTTSLLKTVEYGGSLRYCLNYEEPSLLKQTGYSNLFSTYYENWTAEITEQYAAYDPIYRAIRHAEMTGHEQLAPGIFRTVYNNGTAVYVNYTDTDYTAGSIAVGAKSYAAQLP